MDLLKRIHKSLLVCWWGHYAVSWFILRYHKYPVQLINIRHQTEGGSRLERLSECHSREEAFIWFWVNCEHIRHTDVTYVMGKHMGRWEDGQMGLHLPDPNPHLLTCSAEPFNKTRIIAWHYFNHIPSVEYLADDKHAPGSTRNPLPPFPLSFFPLP